MSLSRMRSTGCRGVTRPVTYVTVGDAGGGHHGVTRYVTLLLDQKQTGQGRDESGSHNSMQQPRKLRIAWMAETVFIKANIISSLYCCYHCTFIYSFVSDRVYSDLDTCNHPSIYDLQRCWWKIVSAEEYAGCAIIYVYFLHMFPSHRQSLTSSNLH